MIPFGFTPFLYHFTTIKRLSYHLSDNFLHSLLIAKFAVEVYKANSYGMTILEQILAGLQQKFVGVDTAILTRIATKKAEV